MFSYKLSPREVALRKQILSITSASYIPTTEEAELPTNKKDIVKGMQGIQDAIYDKTGLLASDHFGADDLEFLYNHLPKTTRQMLKLCGRDDPFKMTVYDLRHSLISTQGSDAAVKIEQARELARAAVDLIKTNIKKSTTNSKAAYQPVCLLELGSGPSDVSSMVWTLIMEGIQKKKLRLAGKLPTDFFEIVDVEYQETTGKTAAKLMKACGRTNISVRYGPKIGDATTLEGLADSSFDIVWSSLMLGAFGEPAPESEQQTPAASPTGSFSSETFFNDLALQRTATNIVPAARAVILQAHRVCKHGGLIMHTDFVYLYGRDDVPWAVENYKKRDFKMMLPFRMEAIAHGRNRGLLRADYHPLRKNISPFFRKLNQVLTTREFDFWAWFDGGDFAAWELTKAADRGDYSNVDVKRFCGAVPSIGKAAVALAAIYFGNGWEKMSDDEFAQAMSHLKQAGTSFVMVTGKVNKE